VVAENITMPSFSFTDSKAIKSHILSSSTPLLYELPKEINTHGYLRTLLEQNAGFLQNGFNQLLQMKLKESFIMPKRISRQPQANSIEFQGDFESANLEFVAGISENEYELYLRNDTNTHGHQSWFLFRVKNTHTEEKTVTFNICNLKRNLTMFADGAKVYARQLSENNNPISEWTPTGSNYQFKCNSNPKFGSTKAYRLSFELILQPESVCEVSLLPAYTYTDMLNDISQMDSCKHMATSTLTYSLVGLAIPLLTFTRGDNPHKQVILLSCRIHPG
jgi:hypothetical protein